MLKEFIVHGRPASDEYWSECSRDLPRSHSLFANLSNEGIDLSGQHEAPLATHKVESEQHRALSAHHTAQITNNRQVIRGRGW